MAGLHAVDFLPNDLYVRFNGAPHSPVFYFCCMVQLRHYWTWFSNDNQRLSSHDFDDYICPMLKSCKTYTRTVRHGGSKRLGSISEHIFTSYSNDMCRVVGLGSLSNTCRNTRSYGVGFTDNQLQRHLTVIHNFIGCLIGDMHADWELYWL